MYGSVPEDKMKSHLPKPERFLGLAVPGFPSYKITELKGSGGNAHVFRAHSDENFGDIACKVIPVENVSGISWRDELRKPNQLRSPGIVHCIEASIWDNPELDFSGIVICSEFVPGESLKDYLKRNRRHLAITFVERFFRFIFPIFKELEDRHYSHGDLHTGNVLVEDCSSLLGSEPYVFRLTDFACSPSPTGASPKDDYLQLALLVRELLENVDYQASNARDRFVFDEINETLLGKSLLDSDRTRDPAARNPVLLFELLAGFDSRWNLAQTSEGLALTSPFDYLSCEQIGAAHHLLKSLYSEQFLGLPSIEERNNVVLTGPRGCGKSTVYRSLSLKHRTLTGNDDLSGIQYIGVYYRCDDLYYAFPRYTLSLDEEALNVPIHYATSTLLVALLESVEGWARRTFGVEFERAQAHISSVLWEALELSVSNTPGAFTFKAIVDRLRKERKRAADKYKYYKSHPNIGSYFGPDVLPRACSVLLEHLPVAGNLPVYFFVDDYSSPKVTADLQRNLNRLFMQRCSACFFKLSTESPVSFERGDSDEKNYVEGREFRLINLFSVFIHTDPTRRQAFIEDIFDRRLQLVKGYPVQDLVSLIGESALPSYNQVARNIRAKEYPELHGRQSLNDLCSGDLHYVIDLVGKMVSLNGGPSALKIAGSPCIPKAIQSQAIREYCGDFLRSLREIPNGSHMVDVVTAFANVAHSYLRYRDSKNEGSNPPHQASRIEPYTSLELSPVAERIYKELLRYSVLVEDVRGKSIHGNVVQRLYLRRLLIPHFNLTFSNRDSVSLKNEDIELLLVTPDKFYNRFRLTAFGSSPDQNSFWPEV
jgi:serine/threonine protein kinase